MISWINIMICVVFCDTTVFIHWWHIHSNQITLLAIYIVQICSHSLVNLVQTETDNLRIFLAYLDIPQQQLRLTNNKHSANSAASVNCLLHHRNTSLRGMTKSSTCTFSKRGLHSYPIYIYK
jgi:hypothetical protein